MFHTILVSECITYAASYGIKSLTFCVLGLGLGLEGQDLGLSLCLDTFVRESITGLSVSIPSALRICFSVQVRFCTIYLINYSTIRQQTGTCNRLQCRQEKQI